MTDLCRASSEIALRLVEDIPAFYSSLQVRQLVYQVMLREHNIVVGNCELRLGKIWVLFMRAISGMKFFLHTVEIIMHKKPAYCCSPLPAIWAWKSC